MRFLVKHSLERFQLIPVAVEGVCAGGEGIGHVSMAPCQFGGGQMDTCRSGKQSIIEGTVASATSKETEIRFINVTRARLQDRNKPGPQ
jgi:hypothetical protein